MLKEITGFPGYKVSDTGFVYNSRNNTVVTKYAGKHGHIIVSMNDGTYWKTCLLCRLVAEAFVPNPDNYRYVAYHDGNKENVSAQNLYWVDRKICNSSALVATDIATDEILHFEDMNSAVQHIVDTKRAIYAGRLCSPITIRKNITNALKQPDLYPYMYGYEWNKDEE